MGLRVIFIACSAALAASGCASTDTQGLREQPSFHAGYGDGCLTVGEENKSFSTKRQRDEYLFENDRAYRAGWRSGYLDCDNQVPKLSTGGRVLGEEGEF